MAKDRNGKFNIFLKKDDMELMPSQVDNKLKNFDGEYDWIGATSLKAKLKGMMKRKEVSSCPILVKMKDDGVDKVKKRYREETATANVNVKKADPTIINTLLKQHEEHNIDPLATVLPPE